jgi:membrane-bound serine protease (ClpP class)
MENPMMKRETETKGSSAVGSGNPPRTRWGVLGYLFLALLLLPARTIADGREVWVMPIEGVISPVMADFTIETLERADEGSVECLIITMDTPGGLDTSMREIVKEMMASSVPVVVFVYPKGSRAASAGVWITLASHVAAMAPGTNIGAAHPVMMGGAGFGDEGDEEENGEAKKSGSVMEEKILNDAVAHIRAVAEERKRNAEWAERAVRESVSVTAEEALELGVIDLVCTDLEDLVRKIDGRTTLVNDKERVIETAGARLVEVEMSLRYRFLRIITNPSIAYILMLLGIYGIFFELSNPGSILPGVVGVIFLVLAMYAFHWLPINYAGLALIGLAIILFIAEVKITSFGLLTVGGVISMILGSLMLIDPEVPYLRISWTVIVPAVLATAAFFVLAFGLVLRAHRRKPVTGKEGLIGEMTVAETPLSPTGKVFVHGELWTAVCDRKVKKGRPVRVVGIDHMTLIVEAVEEE